MVADATNDAQEINVVTETFDVYYDAMDTLSLDSKLSAEVLVSGEISHTWILDSGASLHVTPHRDWFTQYEETYGVVTLGDSYTYDIIGVSDITIEFSNGMRLVIEKVHHVPSLTRNLISVGQLVDDLGYKVDFVN